MKVISWVAGMQLKLKIYSKFLPEEKIKQKIKLKKPNVPFLTSNRLFYNKTKVDIYINR